MRLPPVVPERPDGRADERRSGRRESGAWLLLAMPLAIFLGLPLLALLLYGSPGDVVANLGRPTVVRAIALSLQTSFWATVLAVLLGTPVAYVLARRSFRGRALLDLLIDLPIVLPPAVAGLALLLVFGRAGWVGAPLAALGIRITFTEIAVILAQTYIAASLYVRAAAVGFANIELELEDAAAMDGAGAGQIFRQITIPLARRALLTGIIVAWARALGEFGATIVFAGNLPGRTQTMPLAIYLGFETDIGLAVTLSVILVGFAGLALLLTRMLLRRAGAQD